VRRLTLERRNQVNLPLGIFVMPGPFAAGSVIVMIPCVILWRCSGTPWRGWRRVR
jgi:hypothetical protein